MYKNNFNKKSAIYCAALVLAVIIFNIFTFSVDETEYAVVLKFGKPVKEYLEPGLKFKWIWPINSVAFVEKRYSIYESEPHEMYTLDKKTLEINDFAPFRITNPTQFLAAAGNLEGAQKRIDDTIYSSQKNMFGIYNFDEIVVTKRAEVLNEVTKLTQAGLKSYFIETPFVRVNRVDLPELNKEAVVNRMIQERQQEAAKYRAEGEGEEYRIKSEADMKATQIVTAAEREAKEIKGKGDAEATQIYNEFYTIDPTFFDLYRGLDAVKQVYADKNTVRKFVLEEDNPLMKYILSK